MDHITQAVVDISRVYYISNRSVILYSYTLFMLRTYFEYDP